MKLPFSPSKYSSSPVVCSTLQIWPQFKQKHTFVTYSNFSMLSPLCNNHLFPAGKIDFTYTQWQRVGIARCSDFYIETHLPVLKTFQRNFKCLSPIYFATFKSDILFKLRAQLFLTCHLLHYWMNGYVLK